MADYAMQITHKMGQDVMINVPILEEDPDLMGDEVETKLGVVFAKADKIASVQAELNAKGTAAGVLGARSVPAYGPADAGGARAQGSDPMAPVCACGVPRKYKEGTSKAGNAYKGYFCANNVCKPDFRK